MFSQRMHLQPEEEERMPKMSPKLDREIDILDSFTGMAQRAARAQGQ